MGTSSPETGLTIDRLSVTRDHRQVLDAVSTTWRAGALTLIIGPNGAGKSTLLKAAAGLLPEASGSVTWTATGERVHQMAPLARARLVSWVPDASDVPFPFTALETVLLGRFPWHQGSPRPADREAAAAALARLGLEALAGRPLTALSSGERHKVLIARALAGEAPCLLLDEPCANLDVGAALRLMHVLRGLAGAGKTVVASVHEIALAHRFAGEALCLAGGAVAAAGAAATVFTPAVLDPVFGVTTQVARTAEGDVSLQFSVPMTASR